MINHFRFMSAAPLLVLLTYYGCTKEESHQGVVGNYYAIAVEAPRGVENPLFRWDIAGLPEESGMAPADLILRENGKEMVFQPDREGDYTLKLTVFDRRGKKVASQTYEFLIEQAPTVPPEEETGEATVEEGTGAAPGTGTLQEVAETLVAGTAEAESLVSVSGDTQWAPAGKKQKEIGIEKPSGEEGVALLATKSVEKSRPPSARGTSIPKVRGRQTIQMASWPSLEEAEAQMDELRSLGFDAYVQKAYFKTTGEAWYRVRVGSFDSHDAASQAARDIETATGLHAWIDHVRMDY
ncbi:MAG: SPOR domain-containing protein [Fidelibacterota bacterium]